VSRLQSTQTYQIGNKETQFRESSTGSTIPASVYDNITAIVLSG